MPLLLIVAILQARKKRYYTVDARVYEDAINIYGTKDHAERDVKELNTKRENLKSDIETLEKEYTERLNSLENMLTVEYLDNRDYSEMPSSEIKNLLINETLDQKELVKNGKAVINGNPLSKEAKNYERQILKSFNTDADLLFMKLTYSNVDTTRNRLVNSYQNINKIFSQDNVKISREYLNSKLAELNYLHQYNKKVEDEKEQQRAIKEQMREEEKVRREIEREKKKLEKEEIQFKNEQNKLIEYMRKTDDTIEKQLYVDKIKELEEKLALIEKDKANILERESNTRAGFVYIISNIGSFGEDIYKIGMTRRLEPMDRVRELGTASVPFEFDVHAMIFSEDAPKLENGLHRHFADRQINIVNYRKEFYNVKLSEVEEYVKENFNNTVEFTEFAKAEQYRESLRIAEKTNTEVKELETEEVNKNL